MSIAVFLKNNLKNIPPSIGKQINKIPYGVRPGIGKIYTQRKQEISQIEHIDQKKFVFERIKTLVEHSYHNIKFYKEYYDQSNFHPAQLKSFDDIVKIPIITKAILNEYPLEDRSFPVPGRYIVNTGGSSGTPFGFYIEPSSMGHEWAHMHTIWENLRYKPSDLKIVFGGRSDVNSLVEYDVIRNHFAIDIYADYKEVCIKLKQILKKHSIKYLHGYPSSIYDFAVYCESNDREITEILSKNLVGAFLGSEYPHKHYREKIESVFGIKTISWYGHTERAVLAYEKYNQFEYYPFLTYGYAEILKKTNNENALISTSYYNFTSPLIRYNTEDLVQEPKFKNDILESFKILKGRNGEFVKDLDNKNINLTGLIFGRHHELFNFSKFIQVKQIDIGVIEIYFVSDSVSEEQASKLFDQNNLNFKISFKKIPEPIRSISGKIGLLIK